jgi:hypothetical protein
MIENGSNMKDKCSYSNSDMIEIWTDIEKSLKLDISKSIIIKKYINMPILMRRQFLLKYGIHKD